MEKTIIVMPVANEEETIGATLQGIIDFGYENLFGAIGLLIVALVPIVCNGLFGASVSFGGTSLIIVVSVILETLKQVESQMLVRNYKGFLSE